MTLALDQVRDLDCVLTTSPLALGLSSRTVTGAAAVLRRILYRWCTPRGALSWALGVGVAQPVHALRGVVLSDRDRLGLSQALRREAVDEDYVSSCSVTATQSATGALSIRASVTLVDGITYPLEVTVSEAAAALAAIGAT